jgi:DNA-binding NarL/FixJ family response regulator
LIRVFIADDHPVVREGLKRIVMSEDGLVLAGEGATSAETLRKVPESEVDVLLLDLEMPGRGGLDVLRELKQLLPGIGVVILSHYPEDPYAVRAIQAGASSFLTKVTPPEKLVEAIKKVAKGERHISEEVAEQLAFYVGGERRDKPHELLSHREFQVLCMIGKGMTVSEIAGELALSVKTISTYRSRLLEKMSLGNNAQLMRYAVDHSLV